MTDDSCRSTQIFDTTGFLKLAASGQMTIPYGDTSFTELKAYYKELIKPDAETAAGFVLGGMTMLSDLRAAFFECRKYGKPIYVTLPVDDDLETIHELPADAALIVMQALGAAKFGICSDDADTLIDVIARLRPFAEIPLYVQPKNGSLSDEAITELLINGADGFCGLDGECAERAEKIISGKNYTVRETEQVESLKLANERDAFFLEPDTTEISFPVECNAGMSEELLEANESHGYDVLKIMINTPDDALDFADNAYNSMLPVMFSSEDEVALKLALMLYQGRALIDGTSMIEEEELRKAAQKYGAVIY